MKKVIKYGVVSGNLNGYGNIFEKMEEVLNEGWQPIGGMFHDPECREYMQTIVMYDEDIPKDGARRRNYETGYEQVYSREKNRWLDIFSE